MFDRGDQAVGARAARDGTSRWLIGVGALAVAIAVVPVWVDLATHAGLYGQTQYDDGVYFATAIRLVSGIFPYRDFVFVQPPGIAVMLAPFAALSHVVGERHALGAARIFTGAVVGTNGALVVWLLRKKGLIAAGLGGVLIAIFPPAYAADHTFLLEPFLVLFCLIGFALVFSGEELASDRRIAFGGAAFAVAGSIKTFALLPIVVVLVVLLFQRRRAAAWFAVGLVAATLIVVGPFFVAAPHAFLHQVIASQLGRSTPAPTPLIVRLFSVVGLAYAAPSLAQVLKSGQPAPSLPLTHGPTWWAAGIASGAFVLGALVPVLRRRTTVFATTVIAATLVVVVVTTAFPATYYDHYAVFSAAFLALAAGEVASRTGALGRRFLERHSHTPVVASRVVAAAVALVGLAGAGIALTSVASFDASMMDHYGDPEGLAVTLPAGACIVGAASTTLVSADRDAPGPPGCPQVVDATGLWLSVDARQPPARSCGGTMDPTLVATWTSIFSRADYVELGGPKPFRIPWTPGLVAYFDTHYREVLAPNTYVFRRDGVAGPNDLIARAEQVLKICGIKPATTPLGSH